MNPFEDLMRQLSTRLEVPLQPDVHQAYRIHFPQEEITVQIDLDTDADKIIVGSQLGRITPGTYRERIFTQALRANGTSLSPRGILAFSEKNDTLVLFQFLKIEKLTGEKLHAFLQSFRDYAKIWKSALMSGDIPTIQEEPGTRGSGMFGLRP